MAELSRRVLGSSCQVVNEGQPLVAYVLGVNRSGTTAVRNAIGAAGFHGTGEGHFIGLIQALQEALDAYYNKRADAVAVKGTMLAATPLEQIREEIYALGRRTYTRRFPQSRIIDKTPNIEPLHALEHIERMWSNVRFVFCRRRGIDNVVSKQRKFPQQPFDAGCMEWKENLRVWDTKKGQVKAPWLEIEFFELENDPVSVSKRIGQLLDLDAGEVKNIQNYLEKNRPQITRDDIGSYTPLSKTGWSDEQVRMFLTLCGEAMSTHGYGLETYWANQR
jgi:hypothetical protein